MPTGDIPAIACNYVSSNSYDMATGTPVWMLKTETSSSVDNSAAEALLRKYKGAMTSGGAGCPEAAVRIMDFNKEEEMAKRMVQVLIADPDENVSLESSLLYRGEAKLTDLTDTELFYEVDIRPLLDKHNEVRKATRDKAQSNKFGKDIFLDPAKIRDLKMIVVEIAKF